MTQEKTKKTNFLKAAVFLPLLSILILLPTWAQAQPLTPEQAGEMDDQSDAFRQSAGFQEGLTIGGVIATVIKAVLGFLGIIFVIIIIINGFKWMTAGGNEEKVKDAKDSIKNAIIGLIIVVAAYAITYFVFEVLSDAGSSGGTIEGGW